MVYINGYSNPTIFVSAPSSLLNPCCMDRATFNSQRWMIRAQLQRFTRVYCTVNHQKAIYCPMARRQARAVSPPVRVPKYKLENKLNMKREEWASVLASAMDLGPGLGMVETCRLMSRCRAITQHLEWVSRYLVAGWKGRLSSRVFRYVFLGLVGLYEHVH
jgi:hypothetical protein